MRVWRPPTTRWRRRAIVGEEMILRAASHYLPSKERLRSDVPLEIVDKPPKSVPFTTASPISEERNGRTRSREPDMQHVRSVMDALGICQVRVVSEGSDEPYPKQAQAAHPTSTRGRYCSA